MVIESTLSSSLCAKYASCTANQSSSLRKLPLVKIVLRILSLEMVSPLSNLRKISLASRNICPLRAFQAAFSQEFLGVMPYGLAINSNLPALKPTYNLRLSSIIDRNCTVLAIRSA